MARLQARRRESTDVLMEARPKNDDGGSEHNETEEVRWHETWKLLFRSRDGKREVDISKCSVIHCCFDP